MALVHAVERTIRRHAMLTGGETVLVAALPRNPLGKVVKPELIQSLRAPR